MPQFDISSFPVQIFWLFILLTTLYVFITYRFLPNTLFVIKLRAFSKKESNKYKQAISIKYTNIYNSLKF